ncbi:MAG: cellulose synthase operon protein YhjQ/BcsQ [Candidatus Acidiferrales bacterium]
MGRLLSTAIVSAEGNNRDSLRACLQQTGMVQTVQDWSLSAEKQLALKDSVVDIVLLDLSQGSEACFSFASYLRKIYPTVHVVACTPNPQPDREFLLRAMRSGVQDLLPLPVLPAKMQEVLTRYIQETKKAEFKAAERLIVLMGSKGGVGTTTVAVNLGVQLSHATRRRVVLLDFARPLGHGCLLLDLQPRFSVGDAVQSLDRLDGHFFSGLLVRHKSGLEVLPGVSHPDEWQRIPYASLSRVANVAQSTFDHVLVDAGSMFSSEWATLLQAARKILVVTEASVPALWTLKQQVSAMTALGIDPDRIRIVLNRWHRADDEVLKSLEKDISRPILARLPNDFRHVSEAISLGVPLSQSHNNGLATQFHSLACQLAGLPTSPAKSRGLSSFLFRSPAR